MIYYDILSELKYKTKVLHDALEEVSHARDIMSAQIKKAQYQELIQKSKWIYDQIEPSLNSQLNNSALQGFDLFQSNRSKDLQKDLLDLSLQQENKFPTLSYPLSDNHHSEIVGILYVLEGARLGGKVIVKALEKNENLKGLGNFNFYRQEGINTGQRWKSYQQKASEMVTTEREGERAIEAASRIFHYFYQVFSSPYLQ